MDQSELFKESQLIRGWSLLKVMNTYLTPHSELGLISQ